MTGDILAVQRDITAAALRAVDGFDFALAGSGAIREHGFIDRPTHDVDLFTSAPSTFTPAVDAVAAALTERGDHVEVLRRTSSFAQLQVTTQGGVTVDVDLAVDWRSTDPVRLAVGPTLAVDDAVASKVSAIYTRLEARDFLDVDAIRRSGRFTDERLLALAAERDDGFDAPIYATQLRQVARLQPDRFAEYGVTGDAVNALRDRVTAWADTIDPPATRSAATRVHPRTGPWPTDATPDTNATTRARSQGPELQ